MSMDNTCFDHISCRPIISSIDLQPIFGNLRLAPNCETYGPDIHEQCFEDICDGILVTYEYILRATFRDHKI